MCLVYANSRIACHCLQGPLTGMGWGWGMLTFLALAPMLYATRKLTFLALAPAILRSLNIPWDTCTWCMLHNRHQTCAGSIVFAAAETPFPTLRLTNLGNQALLSMAFPALLCPPKKICQNRQPLQHLSYFYKPCTLLRFSV